MRYFLNRTLLLLKFGLLLAFTGFVILYLFLRGSLPQLDGEYLTTYLAQDVRVERDVRGIPTIYAEDRSETAFALGFLHAQERFFQMDLLRRRAAGEMAELLGDSLIESDRQVRQHRFKERARSTLEEELPPNHFRILEVYTDGVNSGLEALSNHSFEYMLLGATPRLWEMEDSLLVVYSMYLELHNQRVARERSLALMKDMLPAEWYDFLTPEGGEWDAPLAGSANKNSPIVPAEALNFSIGQLENAPQSAAELVRYINWDYQAKPLPGSNNWAVSGLLSPYRSALLANDIHLPLHNPNIWYRASWFIDDGRRVTGITLPGIPAMVVGSNENISWGFTNSYGDWGDIIPLTMSEDNTRYLTADGWQDFSIKTETINSRSGEPRQVINIETIWGPVIGRDHLGRLLSYQWLAHSEKAVNLNLLELERTNTTWEGIHLAPQLGLPPQNFLLADHKGNIAWTIAGSIPLRSSYQAETEQQPEASYSWTGFLQQQDYPRIVNPAIQRLWTANNRVSSGKDLELIRFDGGDLGARAQQIRNTLFSTEAFKESDFFAMQMDDRAILMQRWAELLKTVVQNYRWQDPLAEPENAKKGPADSEIQPSAAEHAQEDKPFKQEQPGLAAEERALLAGPPAAVLDKELSEIKTALTDKPLVADKNALDYLLVKTFRNRVINQTVGWIYDTLERYYPVHFRRSAVDQMIEYPVWNLISNTPAHLTPEGFNSWNEFLQSAARESYEELAMSSSKPLMQQTWGDYNKLSIQHPLSRLNSMLAFLLDADDVPMSGDNHMPNVYQHGFGASMRMVVSPGYEANGIMQMPMEQSAHPLSAYSSAGNVDWAEGMPERFLPAETEWTLLLRAK